MVLMDSWWVHTCNSNGNNTSNIHVGKKNNIYNVFSVCSDGSMNDYNHWGQVLLLCPVLPHEEQMRRLLFGGVLVGGDSKVLLWVARGGEGGDVIGVGGGKTMSLTSSRQNGRILL